MFDRINNISCCNPGALAVLKHISNIEPNLMSELLQILEYNNIKGSDIWIIYKNKCDSNIYTFISYPFETYQK